MDKEKVKYVGAIWPSDSSSLEWLEETLNRKFSQLIYQECFKCALGRKKDETDEDIIEATQEEMLTILIWLFASIGVIKEAPQAIAILEDLLGGLDLPQVIAIVASHNDIVDSIAQICSRCGYHFKFKAIEKKGKSKKKEPPVADEVGKKKEAFKKIEERMNLLKKQLAAAQSKKDSETSKDTLQEMNKQETKKRAMVRKGAIIIRT